MFKDTNNKSLSDSQKTELFGKISKLKNTMNNLRNNVNLINIYIDPIHGNSLSIDKFTKLHELHVIQHKMRSTNFVAIYFQVNMS